jgi:site-specific recombinase XerD
MALLAKGGLFAVDDILKEPEEATISVETAFAGYKAAHPELSRNYVSSMNVSLNVLRRFNKDKPLTMQVAAIDDEFVERFKKWLEANGKAGNTIYTRIKNLRTVHSWATKRYGVKYHKYDVAGLQKPTAKRALSQEDIIKITTHQPASESEALAIDTFTFCYYCGGISFADLYSLTANNIQENAQGKVIKYKRIKCGTAISAPLLQPAQSIIDKYESLRNHHSGRLFPFDGSIHNALMRVNRALKRIGKKLDLPIKLTTYVSRHSFATSLKRNNVNIGIISEALGHSNIQTTKIYLDSFGSKPVYEAYATLLPAPAASVMSGITYNQLME